MSIEKNQFPVAQYTSVIHTPAVIKLVARWFRKDFVSLYKRSQTCDVKYNTDSAMWSGQSLLQIIVKLWLHGLRRFRMYDNHTHIVLIRAMCITSC
jgi:hypothetical protein